MKIAVDDHMAMGRLAPMAEEMRPESPFGLQGARGYRMYPADAEIVLERWPGS